MSSYATSRLFATFRGLVPALASVVLLSAGEAAAVPVSAMPAHQVVNGIGVQTHLAWPATSYHQRYPEIKALLGELGVRSIRDLLGNGAANRMYRDLWQTLGIRILAVADAREGSESERVPAPDALPSMIAGAKSRIGAHAILGFEGSNELNQLEAHYGNTQWPEMLRTYMSRLNDVIHGDPDLRHLPILTPSIAQPAKKYWHDRAGDFSDLADLGNGHIYGTYYSMSQKLDEVLPEIDRMKPGSTVWATEFGWQTAKNSGGLWIDEATKAKYLSRAILEIASRPEVERGFIYQLVDHLDDPDQLNRQGHFGLVDYHLRPKPSFHAVRNLIHILCDEALAGEPAALDLTFEGETDNLRSLLMQKNNGSFYLAVWLEVQSIRRNRPVFNDPQTVTIRFGDRMQRVQVFRPADPTSDLATGREPWTRLNWTPVATVDVADHPLILELVPRNTDVPGPITGCQFSGT